jgi:hypothetical protein
VGGFHVWPFPFLKIKKAVIFHKRKITASLEYQLWNCIAVSCIVKLKKFGALFPAQKGRQAD